jgi:hypothetical protein
VGFGFPQQSPEDPHILGYEAVSLGWRVTALVPSSSRVKGSNFSTVENEGIRFF